MIFVEVIYPSSDDQSIFSVEIPAGATVREAILQSGVLERFAEIDLNVNKVGVYGRCVGLDTLLNNNDRVEIYRPLKIDPKDARLLRI